MGPVPFYPAHCSWPKETAEPQLQPFSQGYTPPNGKLLQSSLIMNSEKLPADNELILLKLSRFFNKTKMSYCGKENETKGIAFPLDFSCYMLICGLLLLSEEEMDS